MYLATRETDDVFIFDLSGRLDLECMSVVESKINSSISNNPAGKYIFNFNNVDYISSYFLKVIISTARSIAEGEGELKLCCINNAIKRIFDIVNMDEIVEIFELETDAVRSFYQP